MKNKSSFWNSFKVWFGVGAVLFGTYCGGNMASGSYAAGYIVTVGGGWMLVWLAMFCLFMGFFCTIGLNFIRAYNITNYNEYYLTLWGCHRPDVNPIFKSVVSTFFDAYSLIGSLITVAATLALFSTLMNSLFGLSTFAASLVGVVLFTFLTINGAGFLRKFNTILTISLLVCLSALFIAVVFDRGDVMLSRIGNFNEGITWTGPDMTVMAHFSMFLSYCWGTSSWGDSLCNYAENIKTKRDSIGTGLLCGIMVTFLFAITSLIVLPYMPEAMVDAPILLICQNYLPKALTVVYWVVAVFSVVSTAPTFTFNVANRWAAAWKTEKVSTRAKFLVISLAYLLVSWGISQVGLMMIVQKGYVILGEIALPTVAVPMFFTIYRVWKKDKMEKAEKAG